MSLATHRSSEHSFKGQGGAVSADTHTSVPRPGQPTPSADERGTHGGTVRRGRLATLGEEHPSGEHLVVPGSGDAPLTWADDSTSLPVVGRAAPRLRQLMGVCGWAAILGAVGLIVGIRGFVGDLMGDTPSWYEPTMIGVGVVGIGLTVAAFATVHRRRLPYVLLTAATAVLAYAVMLTVSAL
jgi:hypothetical protein